MNLKVLVLLLSVTTGSWAQTSCQVKNDKHLIHPMFKPKHGSFMEFGAYSASVKVTGISDFDISDSKIYGLKALDTNNNESRYRIAIGGLYAQPVRIYGFTSKIKWNYGRYLKGGVNFAAGGAQGITQTQFGTLFSPVLLTYRRFRLLSEFEFGFFKTRFDVEDLQPLPGYYKYFRGENGFDLQPGDYITISNSNRYFQGGLNFQYALGRSTLLFTTISGSYSSQKGKMKIHNSSSKNELIWGQEPVQVPNELSSGLSPNNISFKNTGLYLTLGISFNLYDNHRNTTQEPRRCSCCGQIL